MAIIIDPPSGWMYGFPMEYDFVPSDRDDEAKYERELKEWFLLKGYPKHLIDQGMHKRCRYWSKDE